jgi:cell division protein FtsB
MRWLRTAVIVAILLASTALLLHTLLDPEGWTRRSRVAADLATVQQENVRLQARVDELRAEIKALRQRPEVQERVVRDELGFVGPRDLLIELGSDAPPR